MFLVTYCSCLCPIYWSHVLSWEWRCSWSSADRRCSNYIWVINNLIAWEGATYIRDFTVIVVLSYHMWSTVLYSSLVKLMVRQCTWKCHLYNGNHSFNVLKQNREVCLPKLPSKWEHDVEVRHNYAICCVLHTYPYLYDLVIQYMIVNITYWYTLVDMNIHYS